MAELLKDQFFQRPFIETLGAEVSSHYPLWDQEKFLSLIYDQEWDKEALKQRMKHISRALKECLPEDYPPAIRVLLKAVPCATGFDALVFSDYVEQYGLDHFDLSMKTLEVFTCAGSGESAIRPFIVRYEDQCMKQMEAWSRHTNHHVRRLSSEGCRPRLPWASALVKFKKDPSPILPILENLKDDPELYVQKSVANNLNDIGKDHPELLLDLMGKWSRRATGPRKWIIKQALRSLVKAGNPKALNLLGFEKATVKCSDLVVTPHKLHLGESLSFAFSLTNSNVHDQKLAVDYIIHHVKANGTLTPKVFKLGAFQLKGSEVKTVGKNHRIVPITTRKYYPGLHRIGIQVNGEVMAEGTFELVV